MKYLEARRELASFKGGDQLHLLFAASGLVEPGELYLRAAAARHGRELILNTLPFQTLRQHLMQAGQEAGRRECYLLLPWDFVAATDWRSGIVAKLDEARVQQDIDEITALLSRRRDATLLYLPAPLPPVFSDAARNDALAIRLTSVARELGAALLSAEAFSLPSYLSTGCPLTGMAIGDVADQAIAAVLAPRADRKKVLVTDLDNVVWSGGVAEDGSDGIAADPAGRGYPHFAYQTLLRRLRLEGTLLAAVSRNDADIVLQPFRTGRMPLGEDDFVAIVGSYKAKSAQIAEIASRLNLGLDSFVFVDDNPVELTEVTTRHPEVLCLQFPADASGLPTLFAELARHFMRPDVTAEDRKRTEMYRTALHGFVPSDAAGADLTSFLLELDMRLTLHDRSNGDRVRAVQLINKTNQFNLNGRRVTDAEVHDTLVAGGRLMSASLSDRNGDHGEILACLIEPDGQIASFVMSCRVFQRRVEHAFIASMLDTLKQPLTLRWARTERNRPFQDFLEELMSGPVPADGTIQVDANALADRFRDDLRLFQIAADQ